MRYAAPEKNTPPAHLSDYEPGVPPSLLLHISKVVGGRKELASIVGRTKSLIDQQINGEKNDPMEQCRLMMRRLAANGHKDLGELIAQKVADEYESVVFPREKFEQLQKLATKDAVSK